MYRTAATVEESTGGVVYNIPVNLYNSSESVSVTYTVSGTATNGVDYSFVDKGGVVTIPAGSNSANIAVRVTGQPGTFTGNTTLQVKITGVSDGIDIGAFDTFVMTIKDLDHPLSFLFGEYTMSAVQMNNDWASVGYRSWTMKMSADEKDPTLVWMDNLTYFSATGFHSYTGDAPVVGKVSDDHKTITITLPQKTTGSLAAFGLDNVYMFAHEGLGGNYITKNTDIVFTQQEDGSWITPDNFGAGHPDDIPDYPDLFYYYCVNYSSFSANYPTKFVKK